MLLSPLIFLEEPGGLQMLMYLYRVGTSSRILVNTVPCKVMTTYSGHKFYKVRRSWPNCSFGFFCNILWKKLSKHFGQPSIFMLECLYFIIGNASRVSSEKAMAPHSSTLAWKIPWTEEPGRLQSMGSRRVRYDWATSLSLFTFMHWRRRWQPTPVFLPGESQGWGRTESDTTEVT